MGTWHPLVVSPWLHWLAEVPFSKDWEWPFFSSKGDEWARRRFCYKKNSVMWISLSPCLPPISVVLHLSCAQLLCIKCIIYAHPEARVVHLHHASIVKSATVNLNVLQFSIVIVLATKRGVTPSSSIQFLGSSQIDSSFLSTTSHSS